MTGHTEIGWTHFPGYRGESWNPTVGCAVCTKGCTNCYAMAQAARIIRMSKGKTHYAGTVKTVKGKAVWTGKVNRAPDHILTAPIRAKIPRCYFVDSMTDLFYEGVPDAWIDTVFAIMALSPQHRFLILTKRPERMQAWFEEKWQGTPAQTYTFGGETCRIPAGGETGRSSQIEEACEPLLHQFGLADTKNDALWTEDGKCKAMQWEWPLRNVALGVSVEGQDCADERIPFLLTSPAALRFISAEPLLGPIDLSRIWGGEQIFGEFDALSERAAGAEFIGESPRSQARLDWVIAGGESGPDARPMHPDWARSLREQCADAGVPFYFKQWGAWAPSEIVFDRDRPLRDRRLPVATWWNSKWSFWEDNLLREGYPEHKKDMWRIGKKAAGNVLDGRRHEAFPEGWA